MVVCAADKSKRVGVHANPLFFTQTFQERIADEVGSRGASPGRLSAVARSLFTILEFLEPQITRLFEAAQLVRRTDDTVHTIAALALPLDLHHFNYGLETRAQRGLLPLLIQRKVGVFDPEHLTV